MWFSFWMDDNEPATHPLSLGLIPKIVFDTSVNEQMSPYCAV